MTEHDSPIVSPPPAPDSVLIRDARGSLIHVRDKRTGKCLGCIESGLYEILRTLILAESRGSK